MSLNSKANKVHEHFISDVSGLESSLLDKVDKADGKGLSTNDYTDDEKEKLARIEARTDGLTLPGVTKGTFSGNVTGNATSATKTSQDSDGNLIISTYLKRSGGTINNDEFAGALKINRTTSNANINTIICAIDYLINSSRVGLIGFNGISGMKVRNSQNADMLFLTSDGALKTAASGKLLISTTTDTGSISGNIPGISNYAAFLVSLTFKATSGNSAYYQLVLPLQHIISESGYYPDVNLTFSDGTVKSANIACTISGETLTLRQQVPGAGSISKMEVYNLI